MSKKAVSHILSLRQIGRELLLLAGYAAIQRTQIGMTISMALITAVSNHESGGHPTHQRFYREDGEAE
jgi:hypothetical protein